MFSNRFQTTFFLLICVSFCPFISIANAYSGGSGTEGEPYHIASKADILQLASTTADYGKYFVLTADIDLSGTIYDAALIASDKSSAANFAGSAFTGSFNGNGFSISNLVIEAGRAYSYLGLFGRLGEGSRVQDVTLRNFSITQTTWSKCFGSLAGDITKNSEITRCKVVNTNINAPNKVGLLIGECAGVVTNCHVQGNLTGHSQCGGSIGSLLGDNPDDYRDDGIIEKCSSAGQITGTTQIGGFVGVTGLISKVSECVSTMHVTGRANSQKVGGIAGENIGGFFANSYATGDVEVGANSSKIGGFIGQTGPHPAYSGFIMMTYCRNTVSYGAGSSELGGYAGNNLGSALYFNYYLSPSDWGLINGLGDPLTDGQMQTQGSYVNWDFDETWSMKTYPALAWENLAGLKDFAALCSYWMMSECHEGQPCAAVDWYADGNIDEMDLIQLAKSWLSYGPDVIHPTYYDDFESGDFTVLEWTTPDGATPWQVTTDDVFEGSYSARGDGSGGILELTVYCPTNYLLSFRYKTSTPNIAGDDYPSLYFYIDGSRRGQWQGDYAWQEQTFNFSSGVHVLKWQVPTSVFGSNQWACAWIDNVKIEKLD